jgi:acyloxyacyl hydrolase
LGDSAAAHFHIPVPYMHAPDINETTYAGFMDVLETEFDWPQFSWSTGHLNTTHDCPGPMDSIYLRLWKRNRCNHLDFQNIGVNGADTGAMTSIENSLKRNNATDKPLLVFYALIGNDVCHPEHSLDRMTTPQQFYTNVMTSLAFLDQRLPNGSHVVFLGLVDGRILWDTLHNQTHPIGTSSARVYDFLNCLELNPCWAWLNSNETIRNAGSARAAQLNDVYAQIVAKFNSRKYFKNFDMAYLPFPLPQVVKKWVRAGGKVADLIEPIDGFHPSQLGNSLFAGEIWDLLEQNYPEFLGSVNPHNEEIARIFGNQGGY